MDFNQFRSFRLLSFMLTTAGPRVTSDIINAFTASGKRLVKAESDNQAGVFKRYSLSLFLIMNWAVLQIGNHFYLTIHYSSCINRIVYMCQLKHIYIYKTIWKA